MAERAHVHSDETGKNASLDVMQSLQDRMKAVKQLLDVLARPPEHLLEDCLPAVLERIDFLERNHVVSAIACGAYDTRARSN